MTMQMSETTAELLLRRIDTIMAELHLLRQQIVDLESENKQMTVQSASVEPTMSVVDPLAGALVLGQI
jgi:hypothetical protein